jgi:hypothetical protein
MELTRIQRVQLERRIAQGERILRRTESLFSALVKDSSIEVQKGGSTFAVSAKGGFSYFVALSVIDSAWNTVDKMYVKYLKKCEEPHLKQTKLLLPGPHASGILEPEAAEAAGLHESGHVRRDRIGILTRSEFNDIVLKVRKIRCSRHLLKRLMNLLADIRLERLDVLEWPRTLPKYGALQEWCWELEADTRAQTKSPLIQGMIRDYGKAHPSQSRERVMSEYCEKTHEMFSDIRWIVDEFIEKFLNDPEDKTLVFEYALKLAHYMQGDDVQQEEKSHKETCDASESEDEESEDEDGDEESDSEEGKSEEGESEDEEGGSEDEEGGSEDEEGESEDEESGEESEEDNSRSDEESGDSSEEGEGDEGEKSTDKELNSSGRDEENAEEIQEESKTTNYSLRSWGDALAQDALDPNSAMAQVAQENMLWQGPASIKYIDF